MSEHEETLEVLRFLTSDKHGKSKSGIIPLDQIDDITGLKIKIV